jgi:hypothetical protein
LILQGCWVWACESPPNDAEQREEEQRNHTPP